MTVYFDRFEAEVRGVDLTSADAHKTLVDLDTKLVREVSLAVMLPPVTFCGEVRAAASPKHRAAVHRAVCRWSAAVMPFIRVRTYDTEAKYRDALLRMSWDLHSAFHALASDPAWVYVDDPLAPFRSLELDAETERDRILAGLEVGG